VPGSGRYARTVSDEGRDEGRSVCFDAAAAYYDETRSLPTTGGERVIELLVSELTGLDPCLDIGVGTGRTALPLIEAGIPVVGLDLSIPMMRKVFDKREGRAVPPLVAGDATALPFRDRCFGGATIIHVLHSVERWERLIEESIRVVRPGGTILVDTGDGAVEILDAIEARFVEELPQRPTPREWTLEGIDEAFARRGCRVRQLPEVRLDFIRVPAEHLAQLERGQASWQWSMDPSPFQATAQRARAWAESEFGPLERPRSLSTFVRVRAYTV
jgi:ubiquinone/menaquinone biosynthesis C-methylase UbiE